MARILLVHPGPDFSVADVFRGWLKQLRKSGHQVMVYNTNERLTFYGHALLADGTDEPCTHSFFPVHKAIPDPELIAQMATKGLFETCYSFWPDVIFFVSAFFQTAQNLNILKSRGHKIVMLHTESPYQEEEQMNRGMFADLNLVNDPTNLDLWADIGPVAYVPHSYDPDVHYPATTRNYEIDFSFIGTAFRSRCKFFNAMSFEGIDTVLGGNGWHEIDPEFYSLYRFLGHRPQECVDNEETARIYRMTKAGINFYRQEGEKNGLTGYSMGPREIEMAACGLFFVRDPRPESDEMFPMLPTFAGPLEAEDLLRYYIKNDRIREKKADEAHAAIQDWTFENRVKDTMKLMEELNII